MGDSGADPSESMPATRRRLMASACLLGGPRRRLGRSNVHGISRATQALQGGPDSSHWSRGRESATRCVDPVQVQVRGAWARGVAYLDLADAARIAGLAQSVWLGLWGVGLGLRRIQHMVCVEGLLGLLGLLGLEHLVDVLELGKGGIVGVGQTDRRRWLDRLGWRCWLGDIEGVGGGIGVVRVLGWQVLGRVWGFHDSEYLPPRRKEARRRRVSFGTATEALWGAARSRSRRRRRSWGRLYYGGPRGLVALRSQTRTGGEEQKQDWTGLRLHT